MLASVRRLSAEHRPFAIVLAVAALIRGAMMVGFEPALFYNDSWQYLHTAFTRFPVGLAGDRPSGYAFALRFLTLNGTSLATVTFVQHLAGLGVGVLIYALMLRLGVRRAVATFAGAVAVLEAYAIVLEHQILAESLATLALIASLVLLIGRRPVLAGLVLGTVVTFRVGMVYAFPAFLLYLVWIRPGRRAVVQGAVALVLPVLLYCTLHAAAGKGFGMTQGEGWFLYGRIGEIADCRGADIEPETRPLCAGPLDRGPAFYLYEPGSPALRLYGSFGGENLPESNQALRKFARAIIRAHPGDYARIVARDVVKYYSVSGAADVPLNLPRRPQPRAWYEENFPDTRQTINFPEGALRAYHDVAHVRGWMLVPFLLAALAGLLIGRLRRRIPHQEVFLLAAAGFAILLGSAATSGYVFRYFIPTVPLILCAGLLAIPALRREDVRDGT